MKNVNETPVQVNVPKSWKEFKGRTERLFFEMDNKEEAKAFVALGKLIQLRNEWTKDWNPVKFDDTFIIISRMDSDTELYVSREKNYGNMKNILMFPTERMRDEFYECFADLINDAKLFL